MEITQFGATEKQKGKNIPAFGIDLGTTNSAIAVIGNGNKPEIITLDERVTIPSCVAWEGGDKFKVGLEAYRKRGDSNVIYSVKRMMGSGEKVRLVYEGVTKEFEPYVISGEILKALVASAQRGVYKTIKDVVISVPAYFTVAQVEETKKAGEYAGLNVIGIQKEPTAAVLLYQQDSEVVKPKKVLLYDLGGGTFDVSVVMISPQEDSGLDDLYGLSSGEDKVLFSVLKVLGNMQLGGDDIDKVLARTAINRFGAQGVNKGDLTQAIKEKVLLQAEMCKKRGIGSYREKLTIHGKEAEFRLEPTDFIAAFDAIYAKTKAIVDAVLADPVVGGQIDQIITVGGSTKSEVIQENLRRDFPNTVINSSMNPDESVALGAAIQAKRVKFGDDSINILDCLAMNIGVLSEGYISNVLKAGDQIPCSNYKTFLTVAEGQSEVDLDVYQGLTRYPAECTYLGTLNLSGLGTKEGNYQRIFLTLSVDSDGLLSISAQSGKSGMKKLELINVFGANKQTQGNDPRIARWRRFAERRDPQKRDALLALIDQFIAGDIEEEIVTSFIKDNKKAVGQYVVNVKIGETQYGEDGVM